jgi:hypothetical protein
LRATSQSGIIIPMKKLFGLILISLLVSSAASASFISLNTSLSSKVEGDRLKIVVASVNKGDESAFNVQAELRVGGKTILAEKQGELPIDSRYSAAAIFRLSLKKAGTYPLTLIMHYTDANQYPFSALTCQSFVYRREAISPVFGQLKSAAFSKEGTLSLTLKNSGGTTIKTVTSLVAPRELTVDEKAGEVVIPAKSEKKIGFNLKNFSALAGSTYQVFAVSESEDAEMHYTSIAPGTVKIVAEQAIFGLSSTLVIIALAILIVLFVGAQFFKR